MAGIVAAELDPELIAACRRGDREAFRELFELYQDSVYSIALRYSGDRAEALDIAQDVFLKLLDRMAGFRGDSRFESWLYRVVVNCCFDYRRRSRRWAPLLEQAGRRLFTIAESATRQVSRAETTRHVQAAVARLSPDLRMTVVLRYTKGLPYEEIAGVFGCSVGTVASRLRAHKELAADLAVDSRWLEVGDV